MLKNYFKIAWRNLIRQKLFSLINVTGLAIGLAVCMLIMMYVAHEYSYDKFHKNAARIFVPNMSVKVGGMTLNMSSFMTYVSGPIAKQGQPAVRDFMRTFTYSKPAVINNAASPNTKFAEGKFLFADAGFFNFFSFKLLSGQPANVLSRPFSVVLSQDMAKKYFGDQNPIGKLLNIKTDSTYTYQVTGIAENCPSNSSINFSFIASAASLPAMKEMAYDMKQQQLGPGSFSTYLLLKHASDTAAVRRGLNTLGKNNKDYQDQKFRLTELKDTHLKNNFASDQSNLKYLKIFPIVAVLILLLALVNYMSLSTARATLRAKEIGVRKVIGAGRKSVALQFYIESAVFAGLSFILGYLLCYLFKSVFLNVLQLKIDDTFLYSPLILALLSALLLITILLAGGYPAIVLSAFKPIETLKGKTGRQNGGVIVRKIFTTLQFAISVGLIVCGIIIDRQLYYFRHADTGITRENVVMVPIGKDIGKSYGALSHDIKTLAGVSDITLTRYSMFSFWNLSPVEGKTKAENVMLPYLDVDEHISSVLGLKWKYPPIQGFRLSGKRKVIINELAIEKLHLPNNPVGSFIKANGENLEIAGVVKNFNFTSMQYAIQPLGLFMTPDTAGFWKRVGGNLLVKIKAHTNLPTLIASMQGIVKKYDADAPFSYTFLDDAFDQQYKAEDRLASIFSIFTGITIALAGMGLFGLAAFTIEQRTKEIGVRKILGASLSSLASLLSVDFLKLVLLAIIIGSPIAWWTMHNWLQNFAYHITIQWWMFAAAGLLAVTISIIIISYHALRAAIANPVNSLRSE